VLRSALKFDYWDVADLANKILAILRLPALRAVLTSEGREELKGMRWEHRARSVEKVYDEVVRP
jgi:glycosyltransferase involved in cell wall biosynthesis